MKIIATIKGLEKILNSISEAKTKTKEAESLGITRVAQRLRDVMVQFAQAGHPGHPNVQTGELSGHITYKIIEEAGRTEAYVGSPTPYAVFVEFGHKQEVGRFVPAIGKKLVNPTVPAYPFARPAILQVFDGGEAEKIFRNTIIERMF